MPQTLAEAISQHAVRDPDRPAIVGTQFAPFSFRELDFWIKQIGEQLRTAEIGPHSRIGIMLPPGPEGAVLGVAVASHAISVPLNSNRPESEIKEELARAGLEALVLPSWVDSPAWAIAQRSSFGLIEASRAAGSLSSVALRQVRETSVLTRKPVHPALDSIALIFTTSGTTGTARLIPVTHENLLVTADKMRQWFNLSSDDRTAFVLPGYYGAAIKISLLAPLLLGGSVGLPAARHVQDLVEWIPDLCPTWLWGNPTFFQAVLDRLRSRAGMKLTHSLRFVVSGTTYLPPTLRAELEETLSVPVLQSYGMSEAGILAADPAPPFKRKPGTVGLISRDELTIVGPKGDPLPDGEVGEIVVHGQTVSPDIGTDAETEAQHSNDRWLFTGDLGSIDSEGYLTVVGRTKELINRGGEKISPSEVELALLLHPSVKEAAAFSVPHPRLGENVAAAVVLKSETNTTTQEIKTFLADHLAPFKIPQHVFVVPELPKGSTGKISRSELSDAMAHRIRDVVPPKSPLEFQIIDIWQALLCRKDIGIDDDFFELGGDSLLAVQMVLEVEAIAHRKIPPSALRAVYTVRQLAAMITRTGDALEELVTCAKFGDGMPFFFCHGDYMTGGLYALKLVEMLKCDQPVFLLNPYRDPDPKFSIEEMARCYLPHLLAARPAGAFRLGGFCNGGLLAWELAHQLESLGRRVEFIVLIDVRSLNARLTIRLIASLTRLIAAVAPKKIGEKLKPRVMRTIWNRLGQAYYYGPYFRAMSNYLPPKLRSNVVIVLCEEHRVMKKLPRVRALNFSPTPWNRLAPRVHCGYVAGTHVGAITTHAGELALLLDGLLSTGPHNSIKKVD
jgi:acyl-CoA synthetase (AMP-forming)/AMP-acid ligase II/thioesterase domain-containing protein/acyl carrier protein